ncbi:endolytic transglycosylase MltG [Shimia sp. MMG029]|uniref:endolytic transglycosylase MltG n=1 Tax=Shimia sp. MMG029 TaxID=3021978 RepID=UPI0022FE98ED|nr:endolytic transglycosylase MltG [Shimia sp. MMG029]MDA5555617.1 endolytic transglycosylase MltG [Shimia sp. MMG029]
MWRAVASNALTLLIVALFLLGGVILFGQSTYRAEGPLSEPVCLRVQSGSNMSRVSQDLENRGAIANGMLFRIGADYADKADQLKAGAFLVPAGASMEEIVDIVTRGGASTCGTEVVYRVGVTRKLVQVRELDPATGSFVEVASFNPAEEEAPAAFDRVRAEADTRYRIAVAEGVTSWQVMDSLKNIDLLTGEIARPEEGSLAPDSYEVRVGDTRESVITRMQNAQEVLLAAAWESRADDVPLNSAEELLILASIIEKETGVAEERRQVASVFANRLDRGMRLQTDPTVIYGVTEGVGVLGRGLRQSELRAATPWNTYVIEGLPPTPIANPGRASLEAAANPDETPYIFFVADGTGGHAFATTLAEHNQNVARWRQIEAERANQ